MTEQIDTLLIRTLEGDSHCDICERHRAHGNHNACSKSRQARHAGKWEAHKAWVEKAKERG